MKLSYSPKTKTFLATLAYDQREELKAAGFRWDAPRKAWWTKDWDAAALFARYADQECREFMGPLVGRSERAARELEASRATDAKILLPVPEGLEYMPFQKAGIAYALRRFAPKGGDARVPFRPGGVLIADEMGL